MRSGEKPPKQINNDNNDKIKSLRVFPWQQGLRIVTGSHFHDVGNETRDMSPPQPVSSRGIPGPNRRTGGEPGPSSPPRLPPARARRRAALPPPPRRLAGPALSDSATAAGCWAACYCFCWTCRLLTDSATNSFKKPQAAGNRQPCRPRGGLPLPRMTGNSARDAR